MTGGREQIGAIADRALGTGPIRQLACRVAGLRGRGIALLWHRVRAGGPEPHEAVPAVATTELSDQLLLLARLGDIVPLAALEERSRRGRPRFALTFDDDDPGHVEHTLPVLRDLDVPATFFLSGRWRGGHGPYWWEVLEARSRTEGTSAVAGAFGLPPSSELSAVARALTGTPDSTALDGAARQLQTPSMTAQHARKLVAAGMEIGFHTLGHPSLPTLRDQDIDAAVRDGCDELAADLGTTVRRFAYPHGHHDERAVRAVRAHGYRSAWTTSRRVVTAAEDPMRYGRWDLGARHPDDARAALLRGLARPWA